MTGLTLRASVPALLGRNSLDQLFDSFFANPIPVIEKTTQGYPVTDIYKDDEGNQIIEMALAGFNKDDIVIECGPENSFEISYENKEESGEKSRRIARRSFKKTFFDYGGKLELEAATATFENGLLKIAIPQKERKSLYKSIDIK